MILIQCERICTENVEMFGKKIFKNRKIELLHSLKLFRCNGGLRRWIVTKEKKLYMKEKNSYSHTMWLAVYRR